MPLVTHQLVLPCLAALLSSSFLSAQQPPAPDAPPVKLPQDESAPRERPYLLAAPDSKTLSNIVYAKVGDRELKLDLFLPAQALPKDAPAKEGEKTFSGPPVPIVVWIHGGGWSGGSKDRAPTPAFTRKGYAGASVQYRLSGVAPFPAQIHDCKAAIRFLRANAKKYNIDPDRIGVWGASAGGHLVALLGTGADVKDLEGTVGDNLDQPSNVRAVCDWFGPTDMLKLMPKDIPNRERPGVAAAGAKMLVQFLGCQPSECEDKWKLASPTTHVTKDDAPFLIMHGDKDPLVPLDQSEQLLAKLDAAGVKATLHVVKDAGHGFVGEQNFKLVGDFFEEQFKPATPSTGNAPKPAETKPG